MYCHNCGAELPEEARFCRNCGAELPEEARFCRNCGAAIDGSEGAGQEAAGQEKDGRKWHIVALAGAVALIVAAVLLAVRLCTPQGVVLASTFPDELLRDQIAKAADLDGDGMLSAAELEALKSLRVVGVRRVEGLGVLEYLEDLVVEGEEVEYLEARDLPHIKTVTAIKTPNLRDIDIVNCPDIGKIDAGDSDNLERIAIDQPGGGVVVIAPPTTDVDGDGVTVLSKASLVTDYLLTEYNYRSDGGVGTLNRHWSGTYDDEGKIVSLAYENWMDAPADLPASYQADWTYDDDGQLVSIAVTSEAAVMQGTWEATTDSSGERSLLFTPDDASEFPQGDDGMYGPNPAPLFRLDTLDEQGRVATSTYRAMSWGSRSRWKGSLEVTYDADDRLVAVKNGIFGGPAQSLSTFASEWSYEVTYDQSGRITGMMSTYPEYTQSYAYTYDSEGRLLSAAGSIDSDIRNLIEYSYNQDGCLSTAKVQRPRRFGETITFTSDEDGRITDATIQREDGTNAEYHVEYTTVYVERGVAPLSPLGVCLVDPSNPIVESVPWAMGAVPFSEKDFFRMNEAWLAAQRAASDADGDEAAQGASYSLEEATSIYQPVIDDYRANGTVYLELPDRAYAIDDLDGNGVPELLLGSPTGAILQLWTIDAGGSPVMLVEGVPRGAYTALVDGRLFCHGSDGAADGAETVHRIEGTQLVEVIRFEYHGDDCTYTNVDEGIAGESSTWDFWSGISEQLVERDDILWQAL